MPKFEIYRKLKAVKKEHIIRLIIFFIGVTLLAVGISMTYQLNNSILIFRWNLVGVVLIIVGLCLMVLAIFPEIFGWTPY